MRWINDPPCCHMNLELSDPAAGKLLLTGPATSDRVEGGVLGAFGAVFSSMALPFLRAPIPAPLKLMPLAFGLVGSGLGAFGLAVATGKISASFERGKGARVRWTLGPMRERELFIPAKEIKGFEISCISNHSENSRGRISVQILYRLNLVTSTGRAVPFETFQLETQAKMRQEQVEAVLRPAPRKAPRPARKKKSQPRG
jgi:hypothetical protein